MRVVTRTPAIPNEKGANMPRHKERNVRLTLMAIAAFALFASPALAKDTTAPAKAAACRDDKGHFVKCPTTAAPAKPAPKAAASPARCRDAKGHFTACPGTTASSPATASTPAPSAKSSSPAQSGRCRDAQGHFMKCGSVAAPPSATAKSSPTSATGLPKSRPAGATAQCRDGTYSSSQHRSGTCSHHGGVATWF